MLVEWSWPGSLMHLRVGWGFCFSVGLVVGQVCSARLPSPQDQWDSPGSLACGSGRSTREQIETCKTFWCLDSEGVNGCPTAIEPRKLHGQNHNQQPAFYVRESVKIQRKMVDCIRGRQENWDGDHYLSEPFKAPVGVLLLPCHDDWNHDTWRHMYLTSNCTQLLHTMASNFTSLN